MSLLLPRLWEGIGARLSALARKIPGADRLPAEQTRLSALLLETSLGLV